MRPLLENPDIYNSFLRGRTKGDYEERSGAGAISVECLTSYWTSTGASQALTLADGSEGQFKVIIHAVDGGSLVITPANLGGVTSATISLVAAGDNVILQFVKGNWWMIGQGTQATLTGNTITFA